MHFRCSGIFKFSGQCVSKSILKIGQHLAKLWQKLGGALFWVKAYITIAISNFSILTADCRVTLFYTFCKNACLTTVGNNKCCAKVIHHSTNNPFVHELNITAVDFNGTSVVLVIWRLGNEQRAQQKQQPRHIIYLSYLFVLIPEYHTLEQPLLPSSKGPSTGTTDSQQCIIPNLLLLQCRQSDRCWQIRSISEN